MSIIGGREGGKGDRYLPDVDCCSPKSLGDIRHVSVEVIAMADDDDDGWMGELLAWNLVEDHRLPRRIAAAVAVIRSVVIGDHRTSSSWVCGIPW